MLPSVLINSSRWSQNSY